MTLLDRETEALDVFTKGCAKLRYLVNDSPCHPADQAELTMHIHAIQNLVMARSAVRTDLSQFNHVRAFCDPMLLGSGEGLQLCTRAHKSSGEGEPS